VTLACFATMTTNRREGHELTFEVDKSPSSSHMHKFTETSAAVIKRPTQYRAGLGYNLAAIAR